MHISPEPTERKLEYLKDIACFVHTRVAINDHDLAAVGLIVVVAGSAGVLPVEIGSEPLGLVVMGLIGALGL